MWLEDDEGAPAGFLLGLVSEADPELAYVHMHVVDPALARARGWATRLYRDFGARAHARGCRRVRALAAPDREASRRFHERLGFAGRLEPGYLGDGARPDRLRAGAAARRRAGVAGDSASIARDPSRPGERTMAGSSTARRAT